MDSTPSMPSPSWACPYCSWPSHWLRPGRRPGERCELILWWRSDTSSLITVGLLLVLVKYSGVERGAEHFGGLRGWPTLSGFACRPRAETPSGPSSPQHEPAVQPHPSQDHSVVDGTADRPEQNWRIMSTAL